MAEKRVKPGVMVAGDTAEAEENNIEDREFSEEETRNQMRVKEEDFIQGLIDAADYMEEEHQTIEICRDGRLYFRFDIHPLGAEEYERCKKKHTKYVRNKQLGMKLPEDTDRIKYQSAIIYQATVLSDREKLWDNKKVWDALRNKDIQIMNGLDVIEYTLKAGEKDKILECIDKLSGYEANIEEVAKN